MLFIFAGLPLPRLPLSLESGHWFFIILRNDPCDCCAFGNRADTCLVEKNTYLIRWLIQFPAFMDLNLSKHIGRYSYDKAKVIR
jgi:hypothetical protein